VISSNLPQFSSTRWDACARAICHW